MNIRPFQSSDYEDVKALYQDSSTYGGQFDPDRDSLERMVAQSQNDPETILVSEDGGKILGTVSVLYDARVAWLFRFAVQNNDQDIVDALYKEASRVLKERGHRQVLVYSPAGDEGFHSRYLQLNFKKGSNYAAYWRTL